MSNYGIVYLITNILNGMVYVGQTIRTLEIRWGWHLQAATHGPTMYISFAIAHYGKENFTIEILCFANDQAELDFFEILFMEATNCLNTGYNLKQGGSGGHHHPDTIKQIKETLSKRIYLAEWKQKVAENRVGIPMTEIGKKKLSVITSSTVCVTNGILSKRILKTEPMPEGFKPGNIALTNALKKAWAEGRHTGMRGKASPKKGRNKAYYEQLASFN